MCVSVARTSLNTVIVNRVKIYFRQYPNTSLGGDEGAIASATYVLRAGDTSVSGTTDHEGAVTLDIPAGSTARLEIFGTTFELTRLGALEAPDTLSGAQRRLNILGYRAGPVDGTVGSRTDHALLDYQGDHGLTVVGLTDSGGVPTSTRDDLRRVIGE
jgi:hypothetical protein